ncbi:KWG Leptospira [compost metagenome]
MINSYQEGVAYASRGGRWGFIDKTGKEVKNLPFKYEDADSFSEGLAAVKINGKWGAVNKSGKLIIPAKYDMIYQFKNGVAVITYKGKDGMINKNGKVIVEPEFDQILDHYMASMDTGNIFSVYKDGKWGFIILNHDAADVKP